MMTTEDIFQWRDEYLAAHPEFVEAMKIVAWYEWAERQMKSQRIIEQRWRDVTPPDPEPAL